MATKRAKRAKRPTKSKKSVASYNAALQALKDVNARYKEIGCGMPDLISLLKYLKKLEQDGISPKRVCFVAMNAPFMRRSPV
jgi:hypothetical protein